MQQKPYVLFPLFQGLQFCICAACPHHHRFNLVVQLIKISDISVPSVSTIFILLLSSQQPKLTVDLILCFPLTTTATKKTKNNSGKRMPNKNCFLNFSEKKKEIIMIRTGQHKNVNKKSSIIVYWKTSAQIFN